MAKEHYFCRRNNKGKPETDTVSGHKHKRHSTYLSLGEDTFLPLFLRNDEEKDIHKKGHFIQIHAFHLDGLMGSANFAS